MPLILIWLIGFVSFSFCLGWVCGTDTEKDDEFHAVIMVALWPVFMPFYALSAMGNAAARLARKARGWKGGKA